MAEPQEQKPAKARTTKLRHKMVTFVETAPNSGLFRIEDISLQDLITINLADRRVIATAEATEF